MIRTSFYKNKLNKFPKLYSSRPNPAIRTTMPASTQVQRNHAIRGGRTQAFVSTCEHFDFQLQDHDFSFSKILWKCPLRRNFRISLKTN